MKQQTELHIVPTTILSPIAREYLLKAIGSATQECIVQAESLHGNSNPSLNSITQDFLTKELQRAAGELDTMSKNLAESFKQIAVEEAAAAAEPVETVVVEEPAEFNGAGDRRRPPHRSLGRPRKSMVPKGFQHLDEPEADKKKRHMTPEGEKRRLAGYYAAIERRKNERETQREAQALRKKMSMGQKRRWTKAS